nr:hypothetical protein Itr_chr11CG24100 [Ipomoea trifida]
MAARPCHHRCRPSPTYFATDSNHHHLIRLQRRRLCLLLIAAAAPPMRGGLVQGSIESSVGFLKSREPLRHGHRLSSITGNHGFQFAVLPPHFHYFFLRLLHLLRRAFLRRCHHRRVLPLAHFF